MKGTWLPLTVTLAIQAMVSMALLALPVMAPVVALALGVSATYIGLYVAVVYAGAMLASLAAGAAVARFGAIRVSQSGLVLCAAGLALCAVPSVVTLALGALLIGLGYGPITPASSHLLALTTPAHRMSVVFSVKQTGVPLGGALAGAGVPGLLLLVDWQGALLVVAAVNLLCALVAQPLRTTLDADRDAHASLALGNLAQPIKLVLSHPALTLLAGCSFVFSCAQLSLTTYLVVYRTRQDEVKFTEINAITARLMELIETNPEATGRTHLMQIAAELGADATTILEAGREMLLGLRARDVVLGTRRT